MANSAFTQSNITAPLAVADGGTGAVNAATARTNLGLVAAGTGDIWVEKAGDTMTGDLVVPDEAYGSGWNGSTEVPTKNALYDKIETLSTSGISESLALAYAIAL